MGSASWRLTAAGVVLVATALPAVAHAAPSPCAWIESDLPLPAGIVSATVNGSDGDETFVGTAYTAVGAHGQGIIWQNGTPRLLGYGWGSMDTELTGVDSAGDAVGTVTGEDFARAVVYHDGAYTWLTAPFASPAELGAQGIDGNGNVVGTVLENDGTNAVVVWPAGQPADPRALPMPGNAATGVAFIEDDGDIAATSLAPTSYVWAPDGTVTTLAPVAPGDKVEEFGMRAGRITGWSGSAAGATMAEWDTAGNVIRTLPDVATYGPAVINANDTVLGMESMAPAHQYGLWQQGQLIGQVAPPANAGSISPTVLTDGDVVAGSYTTVTGGIQVPALWQCGG